MPTWYPSSPNTIHAGPTYTCWLESAYDPLKVKCRLDKSKSIQKFQYDCLRASGPRPTLNPGDGVRMQPYPGNFKWSSGVVVRQYCAPRSYFVGCESKEYLHNIQHLHKSTAKANEACLGPNNEHWNDMSETLSDEEHRPVDNSSLPQSLPKELSSGKQSLPAGQDVTKRDIIVKPPNRLCL